MSKWSDFLALHHRPHAFIIPNPWDRGTARLLEQMGFEALATTSAGYAFSRGRQDTKIGRDEMIAHVRDLAGATALPVSADLEDGYGRTGKDVAETYQQLVSAGGAGASIEDRPSLEIAEAADRVRAARSVSGYVLTARCENYLNNKPDLKDTITRLQAYQEAGADVLYAPGMESRSDIATLVKSVDRPVNVLMTLSLRELDDIGVKRVSVGSALTRAAYGAFLRSARELKDHGTFNFAKEAVPFGDLMKRFGGHAG